LVVILFGVRQIVRRLFRVVPRMLESVLNKFLDQTRDSLAYLRNLAGAQKPDDFVAYNKAHFLAFVM
jgi:hypothetical protein